MIFTTQPLTSLYFALDFLNINTFQPLNILRLIFTASYGILKLNLLPLRSQRWNIVNFSTTHTFNPIRINFIAVTRLLRLILRINIDFILLRMYSSHADTMKSNDQHTMINHSSMIFCIPATHCIKINSRLYHLFLDVFHDTDTNVFIITRKNP